MVRRQYKKCDIDKRIIVKARATISEKLRC